ncbi:hypothetical protein CJF42_26355 [Pseudoalteromonas sp. NBT06-2]|uniref:hypothetical protein n=1 Tax=Pseudoalteromonas sp. NBT06-2 TaxID=2025950 RepID=UPI000BA635B0|nr:hypothetical protein [Pseudoalteromonas sp. NBT06-2]PAJ68034.1 hypothetical protein CJF42_26355 [Pseudoalteromonas sp. NBT06-2]
MYKIKIQVYIWDGDSIENSEQWTVACKNIEIPFPPFHDLKIDFETEKERKIKSVTWNIDNQTFSCELYEQFCYLGVDDLMFDEWVEDFEDNGWLINGPHKNNV